MSLGFTLIFGALFSKTWRVHLIFRNYKLKKTVSFFVYMHVLTLHFITYRRVLVLNDTFA